MSMVQSHTQLALSQQISVTCSGMQWASKQDKTDYDNCAGGNYSVGKGSKAENYNEAVEQFDS